MPSRRVSLIVAIGLALVALVAGAAWLARRGPAGDPLASAPMRDPARIAGGAALYARHCASCHGAELEGQPNWRTPLANGRLPAPPHGDGGHTWHHPAEVLFALTKFGLVPPLAPAGYASDMPGFAATLSDDEIWSVLAFIRSRWSGTVRGRHDALERAALESGRASR